MARRILLWPICLLLLFLPVGCAAENVQQRAARLYDAVRAQPQLQPPADYAPPPQATVSADPIAKADVLVFAARPGDALVSAYALITQAAAQGQRVVIVYVTNGDAQTSAAQALAALPADATPTPQQYLRAAAILQERALEVAVNAAGLEVSAVIFLGYPDGTLHELQSATPDRVVRSPYTGKDGVHDAAVTPYRIARSGQGVPYTFNAILHDLNDVLVELNPSEIYLPSPASADETAAAAGRLIARSLREVAPRDARVFVYAREPDARQAPDRRVLATAPAAKQRALAAFAVGFEDAHWPTVPSALLEAEPFWEFDYNTGA